MAPTNKTTLDIIARMNFPLYTINMLTNRHVIVGGGGGSSNTGVANGFGIFEVSHDGSNFISEEVARHETGSNVVMNSACYSDKKHTYVVAGQENHCQLYNVESFLVAEPPIETIGAKSDPELKQRQKPTSKQKGDVNRNSKQLNFRLKLSDSVQTDFRGGDPLLRLVRIHPGGRVLATGGTDGIVRLWRFPGLQPAFALKAHTKEIDDLDFSPFGGYLVSVAKDGAAILWDAGKGEEVRRLSWQQPAGAKYMYKRARFGVVEGEEKQSALYMLANPTGMARKQKSYLQKWAPDEGVMRKSVAFEESLSALAVRNDGRFVAVGTMFNGAVMIYVAFNLQRVLHVPRAHSMFVTGLEFLPVLDSHTVASAAEAAVLSISVDNNVCVHTLPYRRTMPAFLGILILILTLFLTFVFCSYLGL